MVLYNCFIFGSLVLVFILVGFRVRRLVVVYLCDLRVEMRLLNCLIGNFGRICSRFVMV